MENQEKKEQTLEEIKKENFRKPNKLYDNLNVSVKQLDIFMVILAIILVVALIMGSR